MRLNKLAGWFLGVGFLSMFSVSAIASPDYHDRRIVLRNRSGQDIIELYASNVGARTWQEDMLGRGIFQDGETIRIDLDDETGYCMFDMKVVFDDGHTAYKERLNACAVSAITID